jgi:hypothetical protein
VLTSTVKSRRGARARWWLGYKLGGECLCVCWKSMIGGGVWRYRVWSEGALEGNPLQNDTN